MSAIAAIDATYEITDDNVSLLLHDVRTHLRPRSRRVSQQACEIALRLVNDETAEEIQTRMGLTASQYAAQLALLRASFQVR